MSLSHSYTRYLYRAILPRTHATRSSCPRSDEEEEGGGGLGRQWERIGRPPTQDEGLARQGPPCEEEPHGEDGSDGGGPSAAVEDMRAGCRGAAWALGASEERRPERRRRSFGRRGGVQCVCRPPRRVTDLAAGEDATAREQVRWMHH